MKPIKYNRTTHLPWSLGATNDDKTLVDVSQFIGKRVVCNEKLAGENFSLYSNALHARSLIGNHHVSQSWIRSYHARIKHKIPENTRVCGEYVYAKHSIYYTELPSYFFVFAVFVGDICLSWADTTAFCIKHSFHMVPTLYAGYWDEKKIKQCWTGKSLYGGEQEGYVVRVTDECRSVDYPDTIAKFVRKDHVDPEEKHWKTKIVIANKLNNNIFKE